MRLLYLAGPGDAPAVLRKLAEDKPYEEIAHVAYSGQLFEVCRELGVEVLSISTNDRTDDFTHGSLRAVNRPNPLAGVGGIRYHLANVSFARDVMREARTFGADVIITGTEPYPFLLEPLAWRGVRIVPALHASLLPEFKPSTAARRLMTRLSRHFFAKTCPAILTHPGVAARQATELTGGKPRPLVEFIPLFRSDLFEGMPPPDRTADTFRVVTVGRLEPDKGVFDLIEVARKLRDAGRNDIRFDVCGAGSALEDARRRVTELSLNDTFALHGWVSMDDLLQLWGQSHAAVVPTTRDFVEGFNQVVIESILSGRPVVTSEVCPALDYARPCAIEVPPEDVDAYLRAVLTLADDAATYERLQGHCHEVGMQFLDQSKSFGAAVKRVLLALQEGTEVAPIAHPPAVIA